MRWKEVLVGLMAGALIAGSASARVNPEEAPAKVEPAKPAVTADIAEAVQGLLDGMTEAVITGNEEAYLRHVWASDRVLFMEETHFIEDCIKNRPVQYLLTATDLKHDGDGLIGELTAVWRMQEGEARDITFPVRFRRDEAGWRYAGRVWEVVDAPGVRVLFAPGYEDVAKAVVAEMPAIMAMVHEDMQVQPPAGFVQEVKMYESMREMQFSIFPSYSDPLGGWNEPHESMKILVRPSSRPQQLKVLLAHEYGHVGTFLMGEKATDAPWWMLEGIAELVSSSYGTSAERVQRRVLSWAKEDRLAPWEAMHAFPLAPDDRKWGGHVYTQGHHMVRFVSDEFGREARNRWIRAMAEGASLDKASVEQLGVPFAEVDARWRKKLEVDLLAQEREQEQPDAAPAESATK